METKEKEQKVGRPAISEKEIEEILAKLEPHIMAGLSIGKAIEKAGVPRSTVYKLYRENGEFVENIKLLQKNFGIIVNNIIGTELIRITSKQDNDGELSRDDRQFVQWVANTNKMMKEFYNSSKGDKEESEEGSSEKIWNDPRCVITMFESYYHVCQNMIKEGLMNPDGSMEVDQAKQYIEQRKPKY